MRDSKRDTEVKKSLLVFRTLWEKARVGENSTETCILSYMKQITSPGSMHETGCSGLVHWDDPEGWGGRWEWGSGWGTHVHPWLIHYYVGQIPLQYCKVVSLQLK